MISQLVADAMGEDDADPEIRLEWINGSGFRSLRKSLSSPIVTRKMQ